MAELDQAHPPPLIKKKIFLQNGEIYIHTVEVAEKCIRYEVVSVGGGSDYSL